MVVERQGLLVWVSRPSCTVSCDSFMRRLVASQRDCLCPMPSAQACQHPGSVRNRTSPRFTVRSGSGVGFSLASCAEDSARADASQSPTQTTENRMTTWKGRVDARKILSGKMVVGPRF